MVYVLNIDGQPLMPTDRHGKVRHLLKDGRAEVVKCCPFTIRLLYDSTHYTQDIVLGVDAGSKHIGLSGTTETKELYASDVELRNDIVDLISTRRQNRRFRRNRKTRYRKARFLNRLSDKKDWLAPSIRQKVDTHMTVVSRVCKILPVTKIIVETASFDIQKIKDPVLNVHHIESRKTGGDAPNNLITLCETCHKGYHSGAVQLPKAIHRGMRFKDTAFMGIMRWAFYNKLKEVYEPQDIEVSMTFGYITKNTRIRHHLPKEHYIDARCISGHPGVIPSNEVFYQKKVRCHNRQIHKNTIRKGGVRKRNQAGYLVKGYRLFDKVAYEGREYFIFGRRQSGFFDLRDLAGSKVNKGSLSYRKIRFLEPRQYYLCERRVMDSPGCA